MKVAAALLVCAITFARGQEIELNENGCPVDYTYEKLYAHEICNKFYQCKHGILVEHRCAAALLFNVDKQECDWPHNTDCGDRVIPSPESEEKSKEVDESQENGGDNPPCNCIPGEAPSICAGTDSEGVLVAHENCNQYYKCSDGLPVAHTCNGDLLYSPHTEQCDWPNNVDCGDRVTPDCEDNNVSTGDNSSENNSNGENGGEGNGNGDNNNTCNCNPGDAPTICADSDSEGVLIAHENCNQFYECSNNVPIALNCSGDLLYNPHTQKCDWPDNVDCGDRLIPECNENGGDNGDNGSDENNNGGEDNGNGDNNNTCNCNPGEAPKICAGSESEGTLIAHENCNQFYICTHGSPVAQTCSGDLLYNPYTQQCDWPKNVDCDERVIPECEDNNEGNEENGSEDNSNGDNNGEDNENGDNNNNCNCNPGEAPTICAGSGSDGVLIAHEICNQFYICTHGSPVAQTCSGDLLYNPYTQQCDWPNNVDCGDRVIPDCEDNDDSNGENGSEDNGNGDNGSEDNNNGDNGGEDSGSGDNNNTCNCNPGEAPTICAGAGSDGILIAHENCNQFYICSHGSPVAMTCFGDLLFNPYTNQCDWPNNVDCGDRVIPDCEDNDESNGENGNEDNGNGDNGSEENNNGDNDNGDSGIGDNNNTCNCNPGEAPTICAGSGSEGTLIAHENCNQFYICTHGSPVAQTCSGDLLYNPYTQQCDWPNNVDCGDRVIPDCKDNDESNGENGSEDNGNGDNGSEDNNNGDNGGEDSGSGDNNNTCNCNPGEAPTICAGAGSDGVLIAHENCNKFYICSHGSPVAMTCFGDLLFNPYTNQCDWPNNVDCGDRVIPDCEDNDESNGENGNEDNGNGDNGSEENNNGDNDNGDSGNGDNNNTCNCNPGEAPTICAGSGSEGTLIAHENCNQFYICTHGSPVAQTCSGDLLYNPYTQQCDWPNNVDCGDRVIPDCEDNDESNGENGSEDNGNGDNGSEDNNNGENGGEDSGSGDNNNTCNCNPGEAPTICAGAGSDGVLIAHENCNQFYICNHGSPVAVTCFGDLLFNPYTNQCDWPNNVDCGDRVIPDCEDNDESNGENGNEDNGNGDNGSEENNNGDNDNGDSGIGDNNNTCNCNPGEAPTICAGSGSEGTLIAHENCNQFYICTHGSPVAQTCSGDLLYNPYTQQCDWPNNVDCGDRVIPDCKDNDESNGENSSEDNGNGDNGSEDNNNGDNGGEDNGSGDNNNTCNCNPGEAPTICAGAGSDGVLIAHENCNQFYQCSNNVNVAVSCPGDLLFNPHTQQCDWPNNVDCGDRIIPDSEDNNDGNGDNGSEDNGNGDNGSEDNNNGDNGGEDNGSGDNNNTCNCNPGEAPTICAGAGSDGVLIAHENCNQFYQCSNNVNVAVSCPGDLLFNPHTQQCDWPNNVDCGDRIIPDSEDNNDGNGDNGSEDNGNGDNGSEDNNNGDNGGEDNGSGDNNNTCNCNPGEAPTICAGAGSDGVLIAHENCNQFYQCSNNVNVAMNCPGDLLFNPHTQQCDWPNNVDCGDRIIPDSEDNNDGNGDNGSQDNGNGDNGSEDNNNGDNGGENNGSGDNNNTCNCNPGEAPTICAGAGSDGVLIAHENCNQFYQCSNNVNVAVSCPGDLLYNPHTQQCDWPKNVDCGDRIIPDSEDNNDGNGDNGSEDNGNGDNGSEDNNNGDNGGEDNGSGDNNNTCNCNPGEAPTICAGAGSDGVLIAHENCNQFYQCSNNVNVAVSCPGDLLFNPHTQQCDWPNNVDCGDRIIPDSEDNNDGNGDNGSQDNGNGDNGSEDNNNGDNGGENNGSGDNNNTCNCNPGEAPTICAGAGSDGVLIAHENCNQFYQCSNNVNVAVSCPGDLLYNPHTQQCDWPKNVDCGDRIIPDSEDNNDGNGDNGSEDNGNGDNGSEDNNNGDNGGEDNGSGDNNNTCNCNPGEAPTICAGAGSDGVLIAHENCNQFYQCSNNVNVAVSCPGDLLFNPHTQQCDWPNNVDCSDRIIPDSEDNNDGNGDNGSEDNGNGDNGSEDNNNGDNGGEDNGSGDNNNTCNCNPGEAPTICAGAGSDGVLIAHENCNQFYQCSNNVNVAMNCPGDLLFNPHTQQCDWPNNVDCGDRIIPDSEDNNDGNGDNGSQDNGNGDNGSEDNNNGDNGGENNGSGDNNNTCNCNPGEAPTICAGAGSDGVLIAHENCNQFYQCSNNVNVAVSCPGDLLYNPHTQQCDWPKNVDCGDRIIPDSEDNNDGNGDNGSEDNGNGDNGSEDNNNGDNGGEDNGSGDNNNTCNCNPGEAPTICAGAGSDGVLIAHENCNQFYQCSNNVNVAVSCPGDLLFNPHTQQCDWPNNVDCGDRIIPDSEDNNDGNGDNGSQDNGNGDNGSEDNNNGDNAGENNGSGDNNNTCNCNPGEAPTICAGSGSEGALIAHENCDQFYKCTNNVPVALNCSDDLLYNPYTEQCDWPKDVDCGDRVIPDYYENADGNGDNDSVADKDDDTSEDESEECDDIPEICKTDGSDGVFVAHENCNQFYVCSDQKASVLDCPGMLLYDVVSHRCEWPALVDCGDRNVIETDDNDTNNGGCNCNPLQAPVLCATAGSDGELNAHENCDQFYKCANNIPVPFNCTNGLLYNPYKQVCDWPNNVDCAGRSLSYFVSMNKHLDGRKMLLSNILPSEPEQG